MGIAGHWKSTLPLVLAALLLPFAANAQEPVQKRLLFLTHAGLYAHASLESAERVVSELGAQGGFDVIAHQGYRQEPDEIDLSFISRDYLAQFDALMMFTNGNLPMTDDQKRAILEFVREGGGFVGTHAATLTFYDYPDFGEMLGGYFLDAIQQDHLFVLRVEDPDHPSTRMLGPSWPVVDELYRFGTGTWDEDRPDENVDELFGHPIPVAFSRERVNVLLSIDTGRSDLEGLSELSAGGDYPQAWYRDYGEGRVFYTSLGHREDLWIHDRVFRAHLLGGIRWALGLED